MTVSKNDTQALARSLETELRDHLLPFWRGRAVDHEHGGFIAEMDFAGKVHDDAPKGLILNTRILWTFSAMYQRTHTPIDRQLARRAREYLETCFRDRERDGYYWEVDRDGRPTDRLKRTYGQAFCIHALSEYSRAFADRLARDRAAGLFQLLEAHVHDETHGGYFEVCDAEWSVVLDARLSEKDQASPKSMNTHLHLLEAFTNLYRIGNNDRVAARLRELLDLFHHRILNRRLMHQDHFFARDWSVVSETYTYGHDIEAAWLLDEAATVLDDAEYIACARQWSADLAERIIEEGLDADHGLAYEGRAGHAIDRRKQWWPQAEAVVGFLHAWRLTGSPRMFQAASDVWRFVRARLVDRGRGEWHWQLDRDGQPDPSQPKVSAWKGPYHNVRMCLAALDRLGAEQATETW